MGVNSYWYCQPETRCDDVLNALAALAGNESMEVRRTLPYDRSYTCREWVNVKGCKPRFRKSNSNDSPEYAFMEFPCFTDPFYSDGAVHEGMWCFETAGERQGMKHLYVSSTAWWVAACCRLAQMFGGEVIATDYDDVVVYAVDRADSGIAAIERAYMADDPTLGNEGWYARQSMTFGAEPITEAELKQANYFASYRLKDHATR